MGLGIVAGFHHPRRSRQGQGLLGREGGKPPHLESSLRLADARQAESPSLFPPPSAPPRPPRPRRGEIRPTPRSPRPGAIAKQHPPSIRPCLIKKGEELEAWPYDFREIQDQPAAGQGRGSGSASLRSEKQIELQRGKSCAASMKLEASVQEGPADARRYRVETLRRRRKFRRLETEAAGAASAAKAKGFRRRRCRPGHGWPRPTPWAARLFSRHRRRETGGRRP